NDPRLMPRPRVSVHQANHPRGPDEEMPNERITLLVTALPKDPPSASVPQRPAVRRRTDHRRHHPPWLDRQVLQVQDPGRAGATDSDRLPSPRANPPGSRPAGMLIGRFRVALEHKGDLAGAEPGYRRGGKGGGTNGALNPDELPEEHGDLARAGAAHRRADKHGHPWAPLNLGVLLGRLRDPDGRHRLSLPRLSENARLLIVAVGASIVLAWLVTVLTYPAGGSLGRALAPTATRAITTPPVPPRPAHRPQPKRTSATATTTAAQPAPTNVVPVAGRRTPEISSGAAPGTTTSGSIQSASGDSSQTGRAESVMSGSSASGSTNMGSTGSAAGSGSV